VHNTQAREKNTTLDLDGWGRYVLKRTSLLRRVKRSVMTPRKFDYYFYYVKCFFTNMWWQPETVFKFDYYKLEAMHGKHVAVSVECCLLWIWQKISKHIKVFFKILPVFKDFRVLQRNSCMHFQLSLSIFIFKCMIRE
jgi:hypothetical protein